MELTDNLDAKVAELAEINALLDNGMTFKAGRFTLLIKQPYLGTLDNLARLFIKMEIDDAQLRENGILEAKKYAARYTRFATEAVAIASLRSRWKIFFFKRFLSLFLRWTLTPKKLVGITEALNALLNLTDFTNSIILMSANRTTMPNLMEAKTEA